MAKDRMRGQLTLHDWMPDACPAAVEEHGKPRSTRRRRLKEDVYVMCPFYHKDSPIEIRCDPLAGMLTTLMFHNKREKEEHMEDFCNGSYMACPLYQALEIDIEEG